MAEIYPPITEQDVVRLTHVLRANGFNTSAEVMTDLFAQRAAMVAALNTTAGNIRSLRAASKCNTFDAWLEVVETTIAQANGGENV